MSTTHIAPAKTFSKPLGNKYRLVDNVLYTCAVNADGSLEKEPCGKVNNWCQVYDMGEEENEALREVVEALGGNFETVAANFCQ
jgi:hypothetical protein